MLSSVELAGLRDLALDAALAAGAEIRHASNAGFEVVKSKEGDSLASQVLTEVDLACDRLLRNKLLPSTLDGNIALLTEEQPDDGARFDRDFFWCVDPIDGTLAFTRGQPGYAVSIGLTRRDGVPVVGVVYDPSTDKLYDAVIGQGVRVNGEAAGERKVDEGQLVVPVDDSLLERRDFAEIEELLHELATRMKLQGVRQRHNAGAVMSAIWACESACGCYFKLPKPQPGGGSLWDFAATACIAKEWGANVTDFYNQPLDLNNSQTTYMNGAGVVLATNSGLAASLRSGLLDRVSSQ